MGITSQLPIKSRYSRALNGLQPGQRFFDALPGQLITGPGLAQFRRNEDILPAKAAFGHSLADDGLVIVHVGRIDETVAEPLPLL